MHKIRVQLDDEGYEIVVGQGALTHLPELLTPLVRPSRILVVTDPTVDKLHGNALREALASMSCGVLTEVIPEGESHKNMETLQKLLDRMVEARLDRSSLLVCFGGGVVGDIAGFAAAIFMRGIPCVQAPTTLLAQVDSSIGGKVGVDHPLGKNLIGAFYQPLLVCTDPSLLSTLPEEQVRNGMAEVVKYGVIADEGLFALLERNSKSLKALDSGPLEDVIRRCCQIKARIVQQDVRETTGLRSLLNYGHTIGHAIEAVTRYERFHHGEAVSIGMVTASKIARGMGIFSEEAERRQKKLLSAAGLPTNLSGIGPDRILDALLLDKKAADGKNKFVLPLAVGRVVVRENIPLETVRRALEEVIVD